MSVTTAGNARGHWVRLAGVVSLMVLLGVPWVFSAFGVIIPDGSEIAMLQGVFQVRYSLFP